ncbi:hypothetical protein DXA96_04365 [Lachnospiraceae bacterium OF09-33XD]|nr:hypothetical protein DXA96_04365 [Lachnospiraceae bacterium OF09-33XD]
MKRSNRGYTRVSLSPRTGHGVSASTARCLPKVLNCFIHLSRSTERKIYQFFSFKPTLDAKA